MSVGLGMALAARLQRQSYWTYVIMGEGCLDEGQTWEAFMAAAKFKPQRLVALIVLAARRPKKRRETRPTEAAREGRLESKRRRSEVKRLRRERPEPD